MFEIYQLDKLNSDEIGEVIDKTLQESKNLNHVETRITEEARNALVYYSEGYPHFIQQFGSSAFAVAMGNTISGKDVAKGAFGPDGAIAKIGETYYRDDFYNNLEEESRQVLRLMAEISGDWISKKQIRDTFVGKSQVLDKALDNLQKSGLIKLKEDEKEIYRLRQKAFAHWIKLIANQAAQDI